MSTPALEFHNVVKEYGRRRALDGLHLTIPAGVVCGLVGANGAGKTTSLSVAAGLARIRSGTVSVLGAGPYDPARHAGRLALLPQDAQLPREARPVELLTFYGEAQGLSRADARADATRLLEAVHLADRARSPVRTLSHGMNKRLMIAQCFIGSPCLVLLDEPTSGLDPREAARVRDWIVQWRGERTVIISSHNLHEIENMCDYVAFLEQGRCVRAGTLDSVTRREELVIYHLASAPPLDALRTQTSGTDFTWCPESRTLECRCAPGRGAVDINRMILPVLLGTNTGIVSVELGARLETEYLKQSGTCPPIPRA